jgi:phage shock protein PspC (stress-responsive transcriptional regulator)
MLDHLVLEGRYRHFLKGVQGGLADDHAVEKSLVRVTFVVRSFNEEFVAGSDVQVVQVRSCGRISAQIGRRGRRISGI